MAINYRPDVTVAMAVAAYKKYGDYTKAAAELGVSEHLVRRRVKQNTATEHHAPPDGHVVKGVSTLYDADGNVSAQWVKTSVPDEQRFRAMEEAIAELVRDVPRYKPQKPSKHHLQHLANLYTITDAHVGMYAWGEETLGADWDLTIAEKVIGGCFSQMIDSAPPASVGIVNQMGDFLHTDGFKALTPGHGHLLDADSRYEKIVRVSVRILRRIVDAALAKHLTVVVNMLDANHDPVGGTWLRTLFQALYEDEPRVKVNTSPSPFAYYQHGQTMLGFHHGHMVKNPDLPLLFASQFPKVWGATSKRYIHTGHRHHVDEKEHPGAKVIQHPTLAAQDAYAARGGWLSEREAACITYHDKFGQVGRSIVTPEMLEA